MRQDVRGSRFAHVAQNPRRMRLQFAHANRRRRRLGPPDWLVEVPHVTTLRLTRASSNREGVEPVGIVAIDRATIP